jgi:hypothetical protein
MCSFKKSLNTGSIFAYLVRGRNRIGTEQTQKGKEQERIQSYFFPVPCPFCSCFVPVIV